MLPAIITARSLLLLLVLAVQLHMCCGDDKVRVSLDDGSPVVGRRQTAANGNIVQVFLGIPYAQPPIGTLRFKRPVPVGPWKMQLDCSRKPDACPQIRDSVFPSSFEGAEMWNPNSPVSEDCLYLNVWKPDKKSESRLPVLVWFYGGGFFGGSSALDLYDGSILSTEQDVVVVSLNYRLNIFGFFSLSDDEYFGNQGLFDQRLALQWVKSNIKHFGGDESRVTIFGESAGAASVALHGISPLSKNLFSQGIMQSGSALAPWALRSNDVVDKFSRKIAQTVGCSGSNEGIIRCMQHIPTQLILEATWNNLATDFLEFTFAPSIDGYFVPQRPETVLESNFERVMLGSNENEGNFFTFYFLPTYNPELVSKTNEILTTETMFNQSLLASIPTFARDNSLAFTIIRHEYSDHSDDPIGRQAAIDDVIGDYYFTCPVVDQAKTLSRQDVPVYLYKFNQVSSVLPWPAWMGAMHGYEIMFIFGEPLNPSKGYNQKEKELSKLWMEYIGNFARIGDPNAKTDGTLMRNYWPAFSLAREEYVHLTANKLSEVQNGLRSKQCYFWKNLLPDILNMIRGNVLKSAASTHGKIFNQENQGNLFQNHKNFSRSRYRYILTDLYPRKCAGEVTPR